MASVDVRDVPEQQRYEVTAGGEHVGTAHYERRGDVVVLTHTVVDPAAEAKGVGSALARTALDDAREAGRKVVPQCEFMAGWIERHPDYADLVAEAR